ncbi:MAG: alpha/beta hydrolase [Rhodospirillaceae bacterium]|jgi:pimeloyl-ACP methyl ester carboxylesterase|nr:alpha/beta hydrolase [Rhodospirillaceae bacterium]MBT5239970.1 alpha/beta hydrolase [Rhodospirillaceae bacterium]MBT5564368.1 alpha/beta hydrolase [Rhodospirillaceae bacterium]MBT6090069.1 alpha/beta hydrolase [Rhodospirillaceae bacterium]MBT7449702.1 alpha/beta hydrolase [Rhodospirillaceae bacterium]
MGTRTMTVIAILGAIVVTVLTALSIFRSDAFRLTLAELREVYATEQSQFMNIAGMSIHYQDEGEGYPIVLIHGSEGTLRTWDAAVTAMKDRYRMIRLELPGRGLSAQVGPDELGDGVTLHGMVMELIGELGVDGSFHLIGQSSGGTVATRVAANFPDRVEKVVVMNMPSSPVSVPRSARPNAVRRAMILNDDYLQFRTRGFWDTYYSYLWGAPERLSDELVTLMYDQNRRVRAPMAIPLIPANFSPEQANKNLEGVVAPTLVIWAMADPVLPPNQLAALTSRMTQAQLTIHELPTVGHFPALEAPELIIPPIEAFLAADQAVDVEQ